MAAIIVGAVGGWGWQPGSRDAEGHRDYTLSTLVKTTYLDGPKIVMDTAGLPTIGSVWAIGNDLDAWAFCHPDMKVTPVGRKEQDTNLFWRVDQKFSTRPLKRCEEDTIENPLMEPQKVSGSFVRYLKTVNKHKDGTAIKTSSHEPITGPDVEFNDSRPTVHIEQNVAALELALITSMRDTVNDAALWGLEKRCILLAGISWERLLYGTCTFYYRRVFDFEIDFNTFDRETPDYGTMVRKGKWDRTGAANNCGTVTPVWVPDTCVDSSDQVHFIRFLDVHGTPRRVYLDSEGDPVVNVDGTGTGTGTGTNNGVRYIDIEYYKEKNFLLLGIPVILDP